MITEAFEALAPSIPEKSAWHRSFKIDRILDGRGREEGEDIYGIQSRSIG
tara:strand:+ start:214 stop:363 length:150 start_codon:yes stop_codon:yes gene_type:complete